MANVDRRVGFDPQPPHLVYSYQHSRSARAWAGPEPRFSQRRPPGFDTAVFLYHASAGDEAFRFVPPSCRIGFPMSLAWDSQPFARGGFKGWVRTPVPAPGG